MSGAKHTADLKPCPFCGGGASDTGHIKYNRALSDTWWEDGSPVTEAFFVNCMKCGAQSRSGVVGGYQTQAEAIAAWNTRADNPAAFREVFGELVGALERTEDLLENGLANGRSVDAVRSLNATTLAKAEELQS